MKRAPHIKMTEREFKKLKRKQFAEAREKIYQLRCSSAYLPDAALRHLQRADQSLDLAWEECKPWWRKA